MKGVMIPEPEAVGTVQDWIEDRKQELGRLWAIYASRADLRPELEDRLTEVRLDLDHLLKYRTEMWRRE